MIDTALNDRVDYFPCVIEAAAGTANSWSRYSSRRRTVIDTGLKRKSVLVTGANHGIGAATAKALTAQGAMVFITYLGEPSADGVVKAIRDGGGRAEAWEADLADPKTVPMLFDRAEAAFGPLDVLVNNAAHSERDTFLPKDHAGRDLQGRLIPIITAESHDRHFAVNSRAVALMMAEYAQRHVARGARWGRIISVSTEGAVGYKDQVSYWASKNALESFTRGAAEELAQFGVTANIVSLGAIQTGWIPKDKENEFVARIRLGRLGQPEDVADVIVFLASEQARWLTGQTLFVGGGSRVI